MKDQNLENLRPVKDGFDNFREVGLKNVKMTGEAVSAEQEAESR